MQPCVRRQRPNCSCAKVTRVCLCEMGDRHGDAPPFSLRSAGIKSQSLREDIVHLGYAKIVYLGYALWPTPTIQSDHRQAGSHLNLPFLPLYSGPRLFSCLRPDKGAQSLCRLTALSLQLSAFCFGWWLTDCAVRWSDLEPCVKSGHCDLVNGAYGLTAEEVDLIPQAKSQP